MRPTLIDLFAGCGGLGLGLEQAGFETVFVNELHDDALDTYLLNRPDSPLKESRNHVKDIRDLTQKRPDELYVLADRLRVEHRGDITLVAGGPPCQGFSGIGHRRTFGLPKDEIPSNHLYRDMATFVEAVQPKAFLFENVRALLWGRWTPDGDKGEIWRDVQEAFGRIRIRRGRRTLQYALYPHVVWAKDYGVPQNRPRVLLIGIRSDIDVPNELEALAGGLLPGSCVTPPDPEDFLGDLVDERYLPGGKTEVYPHAPATDAQLRYRTNRDGSVSEPGDALTEQEYSRHSLAVTKKFALMIARGDRRVPPGYETRKFSQRAIPPIWPDGGPNITATSLADDYVHFSQPRTLTVREWARLQTFPDWYQFVGKRTTGGRRRAGNPAEGIWTRELPKYTQIGNAVPVQLAETVGRHLLEVLSA